jgi:hypothetical protein
MTDRNDALMVTVNIRAHYTLDYDRSDGMQRLAITTDAARSAKKTNCHRPNCAGYRGRAHEYSRPSAAGQQRPALAKRLVQQETNRYLRNVSKASSG